MKYDNFFLPCVLKAFSSLGNPGQGSEIHGQISRRGSRKDIVIENVLVDMYSTCMVVEYARQVFNKMSQINVVLDTSMVAGYPRNGYYDQALDLFHEM